MTSYKNRSEFRHQKESKRAKMLLHSTNLKTLYASTPFHGAFHMLIAIDISTAELADRTDGVAHCTRDNEMSVRNTGRVTQPERRESDTNNQTHNVNRGYGIIKTWEGYFYKLSYSARYCKWVSLVFSSIFSTYQTSNIKTSNKSQSQEERYRCRQS